MLSPSDLPDLRPLVDPFALDIVSENVVEEIQRLRKQDSAIETMEYLRRFLPFEEVLKIAKRIGDKPHNTPNP